MAYEPESVKQEDAIRHQMEETRASLADKLESLEQHVLGTVHETTSAVSGTVENVKETVENVTETVKETVENVKETVRETFDLHLQTQRHPWTVFGGSVALGFAAGYFMPRLLERTGLSETNGYDYAMASSEPVREEQKAERPSFLKQGFFAELIGPELERLKNYAVESLKGLVHEFVARSVPGYEQEDQPPFQGHAFPRQGSVEEPMHSQ
jgi:ElaB/YqjD/DUF883 family membrane-anchored ribosome-binding protein